MNEDVLAILAFVVFGVVVVALAWKRDRQDDHEYEEPNNRRVHLTKTDFSSTQNQVLKTKNKYAVAPPKQGASYNDLVDLKLRQLSDNKVKAQDPLDGILLERIETRIYEMRPLIGKDRVRSSMSGHYYEIDLAEQTCTCDYFKKRNISQPTT